MTRPPPRSTRTDTLFPYTTLFRSVVARPGRKLGGDVGAAFEIQRARAGHLDRPANPVGMVGCRLQRAHAVAAVEQQAEFRLPARDPDRKSTRLNSSH